MLLILILGCCTCVACNHLKQQKHNFLPSGICVEKSCQHCHEYEKWSIQLVERINKKFKKNVIIKKTFAQQFLMKFMEMNSKPNQSAVKIKICYHGTLKKNHKSIIQSNLMIPKSLDSGLYGNGIYMSPDYKIAKCYSSNSQVFVCLSLPGKRYQARRFIRYRENDYGVPLKKGYDSHISPDGKELVFFDPCQLLPCYLIHTDKVHEVQTELLKYDIPFIHSFKI